jgi:hypothetical protein
MQQIIHHQQQQQALIHLYASGAGAAHNNSFPHPPTAIPTNPFAHPISIPSTSNMLNASDRLLPSQHGLPQGMLHAGNDNVNTNLVNGGDNSNGVNGIAQPPQNPADSTNSASGPTFRLGSKGAVMKN